MDYQTINKLFQDRLKYAAKHAKRYNKNLAGGTFTGDGGGNGGAIVSAGGTASGCTGAGGYSGAGGNSGS